MLATFTIAPLAGIAATIQTATLACQHHTVDACIPAFEALFGLVVAGSIVVWLASSNRRGRSITSGLKLATAATLIWLLTVTVLGPLICPDPNANDVVCPLALPLGIAAFAAAAASAWRLRERIEPTTTRPDAGGR